MEDFNSEPAAEISNGEMKTRGTIKQPDVNKKNSQGEKIVVEFDSNGAPIGDEGTMLVTTIGSITRHTIPITEDHWKKVDKKLLEEIWLYILAKREMKQKYRASNKNNHRLSRGGYRLLEKKIRKKIGNFTDPIPRDVLYISARVDEKRVCPPEMQKIADNIDTVRDKLNKGEFVPTGRHGVLTEALGTPEHNGRVRGMGRLLMLVLQVQKLFFWIHPLTTLLKLLFLVKKCTRT